MKINIVMNWTLRRKILFGYSIVLILMVTILTWALISLVGLGRGILKGNYMSIIAADNMSASIEKQNDGIFLIVVGYDDEGLKLFDDSKNLFLKWFETEKNYITEAGESETVKDIETRYSLYLDQFSMMNNMRQSDRQGLIRFYHGTMLPLFQMVRKSCDYLREINQNALLRIINQAQFITTRAVWSMILIGIFAMGMGLGLSLLLSNLFVKQRIEHELVTAAKIQSHLIPNKIPQFSSYKIAARNIPSEVVSGDFYDFIPFPDSHLGIVIGDVSGKGIPASILMASARASLRAYLEEPHTVGKIITRLNRVLYRDIEATQFITLFYGTLDIQDGTFIYTNAGHNPPLLFRNNEIISLETGNTVLGILPDTNYEEEKIQLIKGDLLLLYTDGITETESGGKSFGLEKLLEIVQTNRNESPEELVEKILNKVSRFRGSSLQNDDMTIVILRYLGI